MTERPTLLIAGIGEGLEQSIASTFASAGYDVIGAARSDRHARALGSAVPMAGGVYEHVACDLTDESAVAVRLRSLADRIDVLVHNAHQLVIKPFDATTPAEFEAVWRTSCLSAMLVAREIAPFMATRGNGAVIFSGATASLRGGARFSAFASAKFALRGFAQSLAREIGARGVHVAHVVLDGLIAEPQTTARFGGGSGQRMDPSAIAAAYLALAQQSPSAWSHEIDLRPAAEKF